MGWHRSFVCLLAFTITSIATPDSDAVYSLILDLGHGEPRKRSEAAQALGEYPFQEVKDALVRALEHEISTPKPNSFVLTASLDSLFPWVGAEDRAWLTQLSLSVAAVDFSGKPIVMRKLSDTQGRTQLSLGLKLKRLPQAKKESTSFLEKLKKLAVQGKLDPKIYEILVLGTETDISYDMEVLSSDPKNPSIVGRDKEAEAVMRVWVRIKSRIPVLTGEPGVGKTSVAQSLALAMRRKATPAWFVYQSEFPPGTVILQTSAARIGRLALSNADSAQAAALETYLNAIREAQKVVGVPAILFVDEFHTLSRGQKDALKPYAEQVNGIRILGATTNREFELMIGNDNALRRRMTSIPIHELSEAETLEVLRQGWISQIERRYFVKIPDEVLLPLVRIAPEVFPDLARPDSPIKFIQDLAIRVSREELPNDTPSLITEEKGRAYAASITGLPIDPRDPKALLKYIDEGRNQIKSRVIGQDHLVDLMVDTWMDVLTSDPARAWRSVAVIGTTGTGKTLTAHQLGEVFLRAKERVLEVDCTAYSSGPHALNSLVGAPNGIISSDETKGVLPEFLSGRGKEAGIIIFNEFDKAHPDLAKKLMEMIDAGILTGGDGHHYRLRRHLVVFTTNRGANKVFNERLGELLTTEELTKRVRAISDSQARSFFTQSDTYAYLDEHRLPPEVVGRIDRWCVAKPISFEDALAIASLKAQSVVEENMRLHKLHMSVETDLIEAITRASFVQADGARPVEKRVDATLSRCRALAWAHLERVEGAKIRIEIFHDEKEGSSRIDIFENESQTPFAALAFEEPTQFMALKDPKFLDVLRNLEKRMNTSLFGQEEGVAQVAAAVRGKANRPLDPAPLSVWLLGSTGVGKTETAKVLARHLYGSPDRAQIISFGKVNHLFELNDIFGPPRGIIGSESKAIFETILESFPEGTVIVFDELSNMGRGAPANERDAMYKRMYEIFSEGKWTNAHGKTYNLSRFTFVLTGNEGEQLFESLPSEDLRMNAWEKNHDRETIKKWLRESGVPEAFLNRIDALIMYRPLANNIRQNVVQKFLSRLTKQVEEAHHVKLTYAEGFSERISSAFFPIGDGARGAERFTKMELSAFVGDFILENIDAIRQSNGVSLEVDLRLNYPITPWAVETKRKPEAFLEITATVDDSRTLHAERAVTPTSAPRVVSKQVARQTAVHEAGHANINEHLGQPKGPLRFVTIESAGEYGGYAAYKDEEFDGVQNLEWIIRTIAVLAAGTTAQQIDGALGYDTGWRSDREKINELAYRAVVEFGLVEGLEFVPPGRKKAAGIDKLDQRSKSKTIHAAKMIVAAGMELSRRVLSMPLVKQQTEMVASALLEKGSLRSHEFYDLIGKNRLPSEQIQAWVQEVAGMAMQKKSCAEELAR